MDGEAVIHIQLYIDVEVPSGFDNVRCDKKNEIII
jgi:hypothetical protein